jgi:flagellar biosynthesis anti-sigma factor FlgM
MHTQRRAEMRIDDKNLSSAGAASLGRTQAAEQAEQSTQRAAAERSGVHGQSDQVQLSSLAETVQALEPDSAANRARLDELSKLVASGEYSPDAESIASKLIEESIEPKSPGLIE